MNARKIVLIFGTRPEAIKLAPLYIKLQKHPDDFIPEIWVTAQHRQMLDQVLETFQLVPARDFDLMKPGQTLTQVTTAVLDVLERAFRKERPDMVIVQGDTTTVFAAALAAFYAGVTVGHVEAGLRTWNRHAPFPEEINRQLATRLTDLHFAPTPRSQKNLVEERVDPGAIFITGNTVIDALAIAVEKVRVEPPVMPDSFPARQIVEGRRMILITGHRRENFGSGFESLCRAIAELARRYRDALFVYPVHLNPNVREPVFRILEECDNVHLIEPLAYLPFVHAMSSCHFVLSDSGGIQEEAPYLGKPVLVMRETTERPEAIDAGTSRLVGTDFDTIVREAGRLMDNSNDYQAMSRASNPFGDGKASERIISVLVDYFKKLPVK
jgi:UDP-N-acetylglucosamine 2-epimerase (non-hydrolysing)